MSVPTIVWLRNNEIIQKRFCIGQTYNKLITTEKKINLYEGMILIVLVTKRLRDIIFSGPHCLFVFD